MKADPEYWACLRYRLMRMENEWNRSYSDSTSKNTEDAIAPGIELL